MRMTDIWSRVADTRARLEDPDSRAEVAVLYAAVLLEVARSLHAIAEAINND